MRKPNNVRVTRRESRQTPEGTTLLTTTMEVRVTMEVATPLMTTRAETPGELARLLGAAMETVMEEVPPATMAKETAETGVTPEAPATVPMLDKTTN